VTLTDELDSMFCDYNPCIDNGVILFFSYVYTQTQEGKYIEIEFSFSFLIVVMSLLGPK
jgi:hypothetical protein